MSKPPSRSSAGFNIKKGIIPSGAGVPISSSSTPSALKPLRNTHKGPANRIQKPEKVKESKDSRLISPLTLARNTNTSSASRVAKDSSHHPTIKMEDAQVKNEIKSEPEDGSMDLNQIPRGGASITKEELDSYSPAHKQLFFLRHRVQQISREATNRGSPTSKEILELQDILKELNTYPWEKGIHESTKISVALKKLCVAQMFGDSIALRAEQLRTRWRAGDFNAGLFVDQENELVDSEDDYQTSDSEDDSSAANNPPAAPLSMRAQIQECVNRLTRGIIIERKNGKRIYTLDPQFAKRPADVFGHNGLTVGDWWPFQAFTLRDGAHGAKMGGIYGRVALGAYSIVVSGGTYDDNDHDSGDRILYSGSKGGEKSQEDATNAAPYTTATQSMITSSRSRQPVRVLRAAKCSSRYAPTAGIRYDGLYDVKSYSIETDKAGKKYYQFVLVRQPNQPSIDRTRPTPVEVTALDRIKSL